MIDHYDWASGREALLRFGPDHGPLVIAVLPLFEESNRTRGFVVGVLRRLAARNIGAVLPELPAQGESLVPTERLRIADLRAAFAALVAREAGTARGCVSVALRGGALVDATPQLAGRWHLSPLTGVEQAAELSRIAHAGGATQDGDVVTIAGSRLPQGLFDELRSIDESVPDVATRTVRIERDPRAADRYVSGTRLWRRSEPGDDPALADLVADDIAQWIAACAA